MVFKSSSKKKISIALVIVFALMILSGIGVGVYFFVRDKGEGGLSKNQIAFGTAISRFENKPSFSSRNFAGVYDGSMSDVVDYSDDYLAYEKDGQVYFVSLEEKQPFVLDFDFDELVCIYDSTALVNENNSSFLFNLKTKSKIAGFANATISNSFNFLFVKSSAGDTFEYFGESETEDVSSLILNTKTCEISYKTNLTGNEIDIQFGKHFAVVYSVSSTVVYSLSNNFEKVLELGNLGQETTSDFNMKSTLSSKTFVLLEFYRASELSSRALLLERTKAVSGQDQYQIKQEMNGHEVFYNVEYNIFDTKTNAYAFIASDSSLLSAGVCEFADSYVAVLRNKIVDKTTISSSTEIEYYYLQTNNVSKNVFTLEKLVSYDYDKYGKIVGYEKGTLLTTGGTESGIIDFAGNNTNCINSKAGERAESTSLKNSAILYSSISGLKGVKLSNGDVLFDAVYDKISTVDGKNFIAKQGSKFFVLSSDKQVAEIVNFATEFEDFVFSDIGFYFTKNADKYNVYRLDKTEYKHFESVRFVENKDILNLYIGSSELLQFSLPNGRKNKNIEIEKSTVKFALSSKMFAGTVRNAVASEKMTPQELNVDPVTGAGYATFEKKYSKTDLSKLDFISYSSLSAEQKSIIPTFDNSSARSYVWTAGSGESSVSYVFDGIHIEANDYALIAIIRLKENETNSYCYMVNFALYNAYLISANLSTSREAVGASQMIYFGASSRHDAEISHTTAVPSSSFSRAYVGLFGDNVPKESRTVNYSSFGYNGGIVFSSTSAETLSYKFVVSNVFVSEIKEDTYHSLDSDKEQDNGTYTFTYDKTEKKLKVQAKEGYAFKGATFVYVTYNALTGKYVESTTPVATLSEFATAFTVDYSSVAEEYFFKIKNISMIEWYSRLVMKDFEGSEAEDKTAYYFYGFSPDYSERRNPAPFGFDKFSRRTKTTVFSRVGYTFEGLFKENGEEEPILVVDEEGQFACSGDVMFVQSDTLADQILTAKYEAKKYILNYRNGGNQLSQEKEVVFDSAVGDLLTEEDITIPAGYVFIGWYYKNNKIEKDTIYSYDQGIIVDAKYDPKTYTLKFDLNLDSYYEKQIKGFDYNINKALLESDFGGFYSGDDLVGKEISKTITFASEFGVLPGIKAFRKNDAGTNIESYVFVGWFDTKEYSVDGDNVSYGTQYTAESVVDTDPPIETLYAHYTKKIYRVDILDAGQDVILEETGLVPHFDKIQYQGSNNKGTKNLFSTKTEDGFGLLSKNDGGLYNLYSVEDFPLDISVFVNDGYFISKIVVEIYDGTKTNPYTVSGSMKNGEFVLSGTVPNVAVSNSGTNVSINFSKFLTSKTDGDENLSATIRFETEVLKFSNAFTLSGTNLKVEKTGGEFTASESKKDSGVIYNIKSDYKFFANSLSGASGTFDLAVLKKFVFNSTTINFTLAYEKDNNAYYNVLKPSIEPNSSVKNGNVIVSKYNLENAVFTIKYDTLSKRYEYILSVVQYGDNTILFETQDISSKVSLSHANVSEPSAVGMTVKYNSNIGGKESSGAYGEREVSKTFNSFLPTDKITFTINLKNDAYIFSQSALSMKYGGGEEYNILSFTNGIDISSHKVTQNYTISALEQFTVNLNEISMNGTSVKIVYNDKERIITIEVGGIYKDVSFKLSYCEYRYVSITADDGSYKTKIVGGAYNGKTLEELAESASASVTKSIVEKTINYFIFLSPSVSISEIEVETTHTASLLYKISNATSGDNYDLSGGNYVLSGGKTKATIHLSDEKYFSSIYIDKITRKLTLSNNLKNGEDNGYRGDNLPLLQMIVTYYSSDGGVIKTKYLGSGKDNTIEFSGTKLTITFDNIANYHFEKAVLKNLQTEETIVPTSGEIKAPGSYEFSLESTDEDSEFEFSLYFKPYTFKIKYDFSGLIYEDNSASCAKKTNVSSGVDSKILNPYNETYKTSTGITAYWDIDFSLLSSDECTDLNKLRTGYGFRGFSLSDSDTYKVDYSAGATIKNFNVDGSEMEDGKVITIYAVYSPKRYNISYLTGDPSSTSYNYGSTTVVTGLDGNTSVSFDCAFKNLRVVYRVGYKFLGWFTEPMKNGGVKVTNETVLTLDLFNNMDDNGRGARVLYAHWEAVSFTIKFDRNKGSGSSNIQEAEETMTNVIFDNEANKVGTLPTYNRIGYTFLGFNSRQAGGSYKNFVSDIVLNKETLNTYGITLNAREEPVTEFTLYAKWQAKTYNMYINTRQSALLGQGTKGVSFKLLNVNQSDENGSYIEVTFDRTIPSVPKINATGYNYNGIFTSSYGGTEITTSTTFNADFASTVGIRLNSDSFNAYAQYTRQNDRKITIYGYGTLSYQTNKTNIPFYSNETVYMGTIRGIYLTVITIMGTNSGELITLEYTWNPETQSMIPGAVTSSSDSSVTNISDSTSLYQSLSIGYSYNRDASGDVSKQSCYLDFEFKNLKDSVIILVGGSSVQNYAITFYAYRQDNGLVGEAYSSFPFDLGEKEGVSVCQDWIMSEQNYPYVAGYKFKEFRFAVKQNDNWILDDSDEGIIPQSVDSAILVSENRRVYAVYEPSSVQGVHFYFYDIEDGTYKQRGSADEYILYKNGRITSGAGDKYDTSETINGGKLKSHPSIGSLLWPNNTVLCGFIIASSAPSSGYFGKSAFSAYPKLDYSTKIEEEINAYAVYDEQYFILSISGSTLVADCNLYQEIDGTYKKVSSTIYYYRMSSSEYSKYLSYIQGGMTEEKALTKVAYFGTNKSNLSSGYYYIAGIMGTNNEFYKVSNVVYKN